MNELIFEQTLDPQPADVAAVRQGLVYYNRQNAGEFVRQNLAVFIRDNGGNIVGGAFGEIAWGWLYTELLWVDADLRGKQLGRELLRRIEKMADEFEVTGYHLSTASFQALDFYLRCGYEIWGELKDYPPGFTNYALARRADR